MGRGDREVGSQGEQGSEGSDLTLVSMSVLASALSPDGGEEGHSSGEVTQNQAAPS